MKILPIHAGYFKLDGGAMFGVVPKSIWSRTNPADENNLCTWAMRCLLIEDEDRVILVDTGMGNKQDAKFFSHVQPHGDYNLISSLATQGYQKEDITDVILTHLHFDHCGGAIIRDGEKLTPQFPNATYWSNFQHWEWAVFPNSREKASFLRENILPIQESGQLQFIEVEDGIRFSKNVKIRYAFGHTDAMMLPQIDYNGRTFLYMADLLPSIGHIPLPYVMSYDMFPLKTLEEKRRILEEAENEGYVLILEHDKDVECCTLQKTEKGIRLDKTFPLASFSQ